MFDEIFGLFLMVVVMPILVLLALSDLEKESTAALVKIEYSNVSEHFSKLNDDGQDEYVLEAIKYYEEHKKLKDVCESELKCTSKKEKEKCVNCNLDLQQN